ncbi:single-stranded DNA-binding protein [Lacticaseibacillus pantheris]|jgi:single-strand DNA-binding protein|uniref:Single-stranded DNA-binding protein n=1 Tax=Lacticaseibacillus pantheris DSM 15945 = JCM 12539 = NBRC 106106 TaxID=1423783 RepID=A0A0R1UAB6_9LACO|nr:single-stranded DNA-binding protein [Lacticaseibacillus pantheris]KRL88202.1 single-strand DNA-binding protein [Lacticaseibacillus pantheris DSM 15945 = JCM 12539 = NBRC 106106]WKF84008.1 single-stranded DNA-binding protein [Lacticaseibacillus pantheris]
MINSVVLVGRLTREVDLRYTQSGAAVASFSVAVDRNFTNQQGERETDFINCVMWRKAAENFANFTRKGSLVGIEGRIQTRNYENQQGQRVYVTEVVADDFSLLESRATTEARPRETGDANNNRSFNNQAAPQQQGGQTGAPSAGFGNDGSHNTAQPSSSAASQDPFSSPDPFANNNNGSGSIDISDDDLPF